MSAGAIADALAHASSPDALFPSSGRDVAASLGSGTAGLAVAFACLGEAGVAPDGGELAAAFLDSAIELVAAETMGPDLCDGLSGVGWAASHLWYASGEAREGDGLAEVDEEVLAVVAREAWDGPFDLLTGLVGLGVYALERLPRKAATSILARVVEHLASLAELDAGLPTWRTGQRLLAPVVRPRFPSGTYDLGGAHGVPGVIGLLAQACAAGVAADVARPLLEGAVEWLLGHRQQGRPRFPYWIELGGPKSRDRRSAWCRGDLGVSAVLSVASRCAREPEWEEEAVSIALGSAQVAPEDSGVLDACLCHGAAGVAHLFNRLYQRTGRSELREAATLWIERALAMRGDAGFGGYTVVQREDADGHLELGADASLLSGSAGIALALAAAATPVEPAWDRVFLLSSPFER